MTQYKIDVWQTEQGLPLNTVQCLLQTRDGYLWVGTGGGLARFDGVRFTTFKPADVMVLASQPIFGLKEDVEGNLWIGYSGGAAIYRDGRFRVAFGPEVTGGRRVWAFSQARDGAMWAATENGLIRWKDGKARLFRAVDGGIPTDRLRTLTFDRDGVLWIGTTGGGLVSYVDGKFTIFTPQNGFPHLEVRSVLADPAGGIWAATAGGGLARVDRGAITSYSVAQGLPTDQLTSLARDDQGSLWIGTWGEGVCRFRDGRFTTLSASGGLAGGQIWSLHADREGSVWVGTWVGGLNRLRNRHFVVLGAPEGLSSDNARAVVHGRNGITWVATAGGGVNRIENGRITAITKKDGLPSDETSCLYEDRDGAIWVGTYTAGIARVRDGRVDAFGIAQGLPHLDVRTLMQDRAGNIWVGTRGGLARFTGSGFVAVQAKGLPAEGISTMLEDRNGTLWFGTTGEGLVRYRGGAFETITRADGLVSNWIMSLCEDRDGTLWIGTNGAGINRLRDGKIASIRPADGLWDGIAQVILEDHYAQLWMTCNRGFYRVSRAELDAFADGKARKVSSVGYGPGDALRSTTFAGGHQPAGAIDGKGRLWLPSFSGLVIVDPAHLPGSGEPPSVNLEDVAVSGGEVPRASEVVLPSGTVPLSIRYTAMTLVNSDRAQFRYRMDGITRDWIDAGRSREAFFPTLPHGTYRFRVAASLDGRRWREAAPLTITVKPRFFETLWFIALCVLALLAATATMLWLRTRQMHHRQVEMERLVAEKTEELRLANQNLERLSFVDSLTGLANRRRFDEALEQEWRRACRSGTSIALIMADVDLFKDYNDTLGHREGDRCLAAVGDVLLKAGRRAGDLVARYGGEEFAVLIPSADHAAAFALAESLRRMCEERGIPHPAPPVGRVVTISCGVAACVPLEHTSSDELVLAADAALYRAKKLGRNTVA